MSGKVKRELSLLFVLILTALLLTGCSQSIEIGFQKNGSGQYEETAVIDKNLWDAAAAKMTDDEMILSYFHTLYPQAEVTITEETIHGTISKVFHFKMNFKDLAEVQQIISKNELQSVCFQPNYFTKSKIYMPLEEEAEQTDGLSDELEQLLSSSDEKTADMLTSGFKNMDASMTISFPYAIADTNGTIQEDGQTVVWNTKQMQKERLYALFHTSEMSAAPVYKGAVNGGVYNTGVNIIIESENLLRSVTINGESTESEHLFLSTEDVYRISAADINGNTSTLRFRIDKTKPAIKGVADGKTYKTVRTIHFSDAGSGIKNAVLNGQTIQTGKKVSKKGTYTLNVTDKAGNRKVITFKIK